jgi:translation initiation factor 3 subunit G
LDEFAQKDTVIRVSNLTKSVTEDDLRDLFEPFGKVQKVKLPRATIFEGGREVGKEPKGFAYITFYRCEDAEVAFDKLQNYGYDHLILRLEWAKPAAEMPGGFRDGGLSGGFVSGYGQKLAQDTKEKVMYTNTLATAQAGEGRR